MEKYNDEIMNIIFIVIFAINFALNDSIIFTKNHRLTLIKIYNQKKVFF